MIQAIEVLTPLYVCGFWALIFLNSSRKKNQARYFLGFFMAVAFLLYLGHTLFFLEKFRLYIHYDPVYIASNLLVYPLYYQYIRLLTIDTRWSVKYLYHYIPAIFFGVVSGIMHLLYHDIAHLNPEEYFREGYQIGVGTKSPYFMLSMVYGIQRLAFSLQVVIYFIAGFVLIRRYRERIMNYYSNHESRSIRWVSNIFLSLVITAIFSMVVNILGKFIFINHPGMLMIPSLIFSTMIFILGFLANGQNQVVREIAIADQKEKEDPGTRAHVLVDLEPRLNDLFLREKLHLNPDLKIWDVSARVGTNRTYLSNYINKKYDVSFSRYVNRFRIDDARKLLSNEEAGLYSLEVIGEMCGFGSYNNFIRVFREFESITPGRYRDLHRQR